MCDIKIKNTNPLRISTEQEELWRCAQQEAGIRWWKTGADCLKEMEEKYSGTINSLPLYDYKRDVVHTGKSESVFVL